MARGVKRVKRVERGAWSVERGAWSVGRGAWDAWRGARGDGRLALGSLAPASGLSASGRWKKTHIVTNVSIHEIRPGFPIHVIQGLCFRALDQTPRNVDNPER